MNRHPHSPQLDDENNDVTEMYRKTGSAEDIGEDIPMTEEERLARYDVEDIGYELGDEDGETDAEDEYEELAEEETEGHYGIAAEDFIGGGFHIEDLSTNTEAGDIDIDED
jgi:hypothetical protein